MLRQSNALRFSNLELAARFRSAAQGILALTIVGSALGLGGAHPAVAFTAIISTICSAALCWAGGGLTRVPRPALLFVGLAFYSWIQSVRVPISWIGFLSPGAQDIWARSLRGFGETVTTAAISLDPGATRLESAKWAAYGLAFSVAASMGRRRGAAGAVTIVFVSASVIALMTVLHGLVSATSVFGVYEAKFSHPGWRMGPFLNANCLAGYLVLGILCGLGLLVSQPRRRTTWSIAASVAGMAAIVALSGSRGGCAALILGVAAFGLFARTRQGALLRARLRWWHWVSVGVSALVAISVPLLAFPDAWRDLTQSNLEKVTLWRWTLDLIRSFPIFGVGRGAFESVFPAFRPAGFDIVYTHPENIVLQWLAEWGVFVSVATFAGFAWMLRPSRAALDRHPAAFGAMIGVASIVLQNFVDLGLELLAPMLAVSVLCGACWGQVRSSRPASGPARARPFGPLALVGVVIGALALAWPAARSTDSLDRAELQADFLALQASEGGDSMLWRKLRIALARHPADPYLFRLGALLALRGGKNPMPWLGQALDRCPVDSRTHWLLANTLRRQGALPQALLEARLAIEFEPGLAATIGKTVVSWSRDYSLLQRVAPPGPAGALALYYAAIEVPSPPFSALRESLLRLAVTRDPDSPLYRRALASDLLVALKQGHCSTGALEECEAEISAQASALDRLFPRTADGFQILSQLLAATGNSSEAVRQSNVRCPPLEDREQVRCWEALLTAIPLVPENRDAIDLAARRAVNAACRIDDACELVLLRAGDALAQAGEWATGFTYTERAVARAPTVPALIKLADAAHALGRRAVVERALSLAQRQAHGDPALLATVTEKRRALLNAP